MAECLCVATKRDSNKNRDKNNHDHYSQFIINIFANKLQKCNDSSNADIALYRADTLLIQFHFHLLTVIKDKLQTMKYVIDIGIADSERKSDNRKAQ